MFGFCKEKFLNICFYELFASFVKWIVILKKKKKYYLLIIKSEFDCDLVFLYIYIYILS